MEIRHLTSFVFAAKTLNFSEAASLQHVNQSTFSQNIKQLEDELGVKLFYRNSREVSLTEAGTEFLPYARAALRQVDDGISHIDDLRNLQHGTLNIGVTHSFGLLIDEALERFTSLFPAVKVNLFYRSADEMPAMLIERDIDLALTFRTMDDSRLFESQTLFDDRISIVVARSHVLSSVDSPTLESLQNHRLVLPARGLNARKVLDAITTKYAITLNACIEVDQVIPLIRLIRTGRYVTVLAASAVARVPDLVALPLAMPEAVIHGSVHQLREAYKKHSARTFVQYLHETNIIRNRVYEQ